MSSDSEPAQEFLTRVNRDDSVELETGDGDPMILVGNGTPPADLNRLVERLKDYGYDVGLEYEGEYQRAYVVDHPGFGGDGET